MPVCLFNAQHANVEHSDELHCYSIVTDWLTGLMIKVYIDQWIVTHSYFTAYDS
jgi:hypothetical protein